MRLMQALNRLLHVEHSVCCPCWNNAIASTCFPSSPLLVCCLKAALLRFQFTIGDFDSSPWSLADSSQVPGLTLKFPRDSLKLSLKLFLGWLWGRFPLQSSPERNLFESQSSGFGLDALPVWVGSSGEDNRCWGVLHAQGPLYLCTNAYASSDPDK